MFWENCPGHAQYMKTASTPEVMQCIPALNGFLNDYPTYMK